MTEDRTISLNAVKEMIDWFPHWSITKNAFAHGICVDDLMKGLDDLPSVTPNDEEMAMQYQRGYIDGFKEGKTTFSSKTGHWKVMYEPKNMVVCSKCGKCAYLYNNRGSAYCPHCGCAMFEPQERSDKE